MIIGVKDCNHFRITNHLSRRLKDHFLTLVCRVSFSMLIKYQEYKRTNHTFYLLGKRITVVLDDDLVKKLHDMQAKLIRDTTKSVSFSSVLNETVRKNLKK